VLTGVDYVDHCGIEGCEDASAISFVLDGKGYMAIEDPNDGYRSAMEGLYEFDPALVKNTFPPCRVVGEIQDGHNGTIAFKDQLTGKVVLEVGTNNSDDYYPSFVANFCPDAMPDNQAEKLAAREKAIQEERLTTDWQTW
jgi:hypothetical protein